MPNPDGSLTPEEELEAQFKPEEDPEEPGEAGGGGETPPKVKIGDSEYDEAEIRSLIEFQEWASSHQTEMGNFSAYLRGEAEFKLREQEQQEQGDDPFAGIEDPKLKELLKSQHDEIEQLRDVTTRQVTAASLDEANRAVNVAYDHIKDQYGLDEDEIKALATATAASGILPGIRANEPDASKAAIRALETTYWATPEFRTKAIQTEIQRQNEHERRKGLAGSLGGTGGSLSRELPSDEEVAKMSNSERLTAMAREIEASLRGTA